MVQVTVGKLSAQAFIVIADKFGFSVVKADFEKSLKRKFVKKQLTPEIMYVIISEL